MSTDKISANITLKPRKIPLNEHMLKTALSEVFPLFAVRFHRDTKREDYSIDVRVGTKLYDYLMVGANTDKMLIYLVPGSTQVGIWTPDMNVGFDLLSSLEITEDLSSWLVKARESMTNFLIAEKVNSVRKDAKALNNAKDMLKAFGILEVVDNNALLPMIVKSAIDAKRMDPSTIIFRVAMAIFHSKTATDESVINDIEDPSTLYLRVSQSEFLRAHERQFSPLNKLPVEGINQVIKFVAVMTIAAYVYYKTIEGEKR